MPAERGVLFWIPDGSVSEAERSVGSTWQTGFSNLYDLSRDARLHADEGLLLLRRALRGMLLGLQNEHAFDVAVGAVADLPGLLGEADADRSHQHTL